MGDTAYNSYLSSPKWKAKRAKVIFRDAGVCQATRRGINCGSRFKLEVHHKTYMHFGNEPLCDLVTLCDECHTLIHQQQKVV